MFRARVAILGWLSFAMAGHADGQVSTLLSGLKGKSHVAGWTDNYVHRGIHYDHGPVIWEMPTTNLAGTFTVDSGGYMNAVRELTNGNSNYANLTVIGGAYQPYLDYFAEIFFERIFSRLEWNDFASIYSQGTSVAFQNTIFAPVKTGSEHTFYAYPELADLQAQLQEHDLRGFANVGFSNIIHSGYQPMSWEYSAEHAAEAWFQSPWHFVLTPVGQGLLSTPNAYMPVVNITTSPPNYLTPGLDVTNPAALALCKQHVVHMAQQGIGLYVGGEHSFHHDGKDEPAPSTGYTARDLSALGNFLDRLYRGELAEFRIQWNLPPSFSSFTSVTRGSIMDDNGLDRTPQIDLDLNWFSKHVVETIDRSMYREAKLVRPEGEYGLLTRGDAPTGNSPRMERGGFTSDLAVTGDWYANSNFTGPSKYERSLNATLLTGRPAHLGICNAVPSHVGHDPSQWDPEYAVGSWPMLFQPNFHYLDSSFQLLRREGLAAGGVHLGYVKVGNYGTFGSKSLPRMLSFFADTKSRQANQLRFMTPYARIAVHVDDYPVAHAGTNPTAWTIDFLEDNDYPHARAVTERMLDRMFSLDILGRSVLISVFHRDLARNNAALLKDYESIVLGSNTSGLIFTDPTIEQSLATQGHLASYTAAPSGPLTIYTHNSNAALQVVVAPDTSDQSALIATALSPPSLAGLNVEPLRLVEVLGTGTADIRVSAVSDGLNYLVAAANHDASSTFTFDVKIPDDVRQRHTPFVTGYKYDGVSRGTASHQITLQPKEGVLIYVAAEVGTLSTAELENELGVVTTKVQALPAGFDTASANNLIQAAGDVNAGAYPERVLAALLHIQDMIFIKATRKATTPSVIDVEVVDIDGQPVVGAQIQGLLLPYSHEEQDQVVSTGSGRWQLTIQAARTEEWSFTANAYLVPSSSPETDPVEVHARFGRVQDAVLVK